MIPRLSVKIVFAERRIYMLVYDGLEEWIEKSGMTGKEFAESIGVTGSLSTLFLRKSGTKTFTLDKICEVTGLPVEKLVRWVPDDTEDIGKSYRENAVYFDKLFELIKSKKISVKEAERRVGFCNGYLSEVNTKRRKGKKIPSNSLKAFAEYFDVEPTDLFEIGGKETSYEKTWEDIYNESTVSMDKLFALMSEKGLNKNDVVRKSGVSFDSSFSRLNKGRKMSAMTIRKIADALGVQPTDLYEVTGC